MENIDEYLAKYPEEKQNIGAGCYGLGYDETDRICGEALEKGKRVLFINSLKNLDQTSYKFIDADSQNTN